MYSSNYDSLCLIEVYKEKGKLASDASKSTTVRFICKNFPKAYDIAVNRPLWKKNVCSKVTLFRLFSFFSIH
jgi:hypothetical protein